MVLRVAWLSIKAVLSALLTVLAIVITYSAFAKREFVALGAAGVFIFLAALPWINWDTNVSPLGSVQSPRTPSAVTSALFAVAMVVLGGLMMSFSVGQLVQPTMLLHPGQETARIVTLSQSPVEFLLRWLFGFSLGAVVLLGGFVVLFKTLPRFGVSPHGLFRAFATPHVPKSVLHALYLFLGVWFVLLNVLPFLDH
jgi:hypothetical protein